MGLFRKTTSVFTMGLIDFRSDRERTARYTRQTRNAVRRQANAAANQSMYWQPAPPQQMSPQGFQPPPPPVPYLGQPQPWWDAQAGVWRHPAPPPPPPPRQKVPFWKVYRPQ